MTSPPNPHPSTRHSHLVVPCPNTSTRPVPGNHLVGPCNEVQPVPGSTTWTLVPKYLPRYFSLDWKLRSRVACFFFCLCLFLPTSNSIAAIYSHSNKRLPWHSCA